MTERQRQRAPQHRDERLGTQDKKNIDCQIIHQLSISLRPLISLSPDYWSDFPSTWSSRGGRCAHSPVLWPESARRAAPTSTGWAGLQGGTIKNIKDWKNQYTQRYRNRAPTKKYIYNIQMIHKSSYFLPFTSKKAHLPHLRSQSSAAGSCPPRTWTTFAQTLRWSWKGCRWPSQW